MSTSTRKDFIDTLKQQLDEVDERMEQLEHKAAELEGKARRDYEARLDELREERRKAKRKIDEVHAASDERWQELKDDAEHVWKALGNSFNYFKSHFK